MEVAKNDGRVLRGWAIFDLANSVFSLIISTAIFPPYFASVAPDVMNFLGLDLNSNSAYSYSISLSFLVIAIIGPILSGIADFGGRRLSFMKIFTIIGSLACMALFLFGEASQAMMALVFFMLANIGYGGSRIFYNSYLPVIATKDRYDKVSAQGYAYGYAGSVVLLLLILGMIQFKDSLGMTSESLPVRLGFLLVGVWWYGFALWTFKVLPKDPPGSNLSSEIIGKGFLELKTALRNLKKKESAMKFLASYFFFIAGVNVVIFLASVFAKEELGFGQSELIILILLLQFIAVIGAYFFAYLSRKLSNKTSIMIQVVIWIILCVVAYFVETHTTFFIMSAFVGLVFGGIQPLARSTFSKLIPEDASSLASYFSLYDVLTYLAVTLGTFVFGLVGQLTGSLRSAIMSTAVLFIIGFVILIFTRLEEND